MRIEAADYVEAAQERLSNAKLLKENCRIAIDLAATILKIGAAKWKRS